VLGSLNAQILGFPELHAQFELLLSTSVLCETNSSIGFMSARACWLFGRFHKLAFQNEHFLTQIAAQLFVCLQNKEVLVKRQVIVKIKAAEAIGLLLDKEPFLN